MSWLICLGRRGIACPQKAPRRNAGSRAKGRHYSWAGRCESLVDNLYTQFYLLRLSPDRKGSQGRAHGPPSTLLQIVTPILGSRRVRSRSPSSSRIHDSILVYHIITERAAERRRATGLGDLFRVVEKLDLGGADALLDSEDGIK